MSYSTEIPRKSARYLTSNFIQKLEDGHQKEASETGTAFIRSKVRQSAFIREILPPETLTDQDLDKDEETDLPRRIVELEPDSIATFVPFKGTGPRRWFDGPRYSVYFGKVETERFTKNKFELMTYENDIRKILQDNSIKDMADQEDLRAYQTFEEIMSEYSDQDLDFETSDLTPSVVQAGVRDLYMRKLPMGKMLMTRSRYLDTITMDRDDVGDRVASRHYDDGVESEKKLFGYPVITTVKNDIVSDDEVWFFAPQNYLGNFFLLQDATLFVKSEADLIEFYTYAAVGMGIGNTKGITRVRLKSISS